MMKEKPTINDVLNELGFNKNEKSGFVKCVTAVKQEQKTKHIIQKLKWKGLLKR